jgi:hypothetical protein
MVTISNYEIEQILDLHNTLRNKIASGSEKGFKSAAKMPMLVRLMKKGSFVNYVMFKNLICDI